MRERTETLAFADFPQPPTFRCPHASSSSRTFRLSFTASDVRAAQSGDARAASALLDAAWPGAVRLARSVIQDRVGAEDAAQSACARAFAALETLRDPARFEGWFYRIVLNEARQHLRTTAREVPLEAMNDERSGAGRDEADALVERIDVRRAIEMLEPGLRATIVLRYDFGMSSAEIGRILSTTAVTARWRLMKAHKKLRSLLVPTAAIVGFVVASWALAANRTVVVAAIEHLLHAVTIVSGRSVPMTVRTVNLARARSDMPFTYRSGQYRRHGLRNGR